MEQEDRVICFGAAVIGVFWLRLPSQAGGLRTKSPSHLSIGSPIYIKDHLYL